MTTFAALLAGQEFPSKGSPIFPHAPTTLAAITISDTQIDLNWTDNSDNELSFAIEMSTSPGSGFTQIGTSAANTPAFSATGLNGSTTYYFRVRALGPGGGYSDYSNVASATTDASAIAVPHTMALTPISDTQIDGTVLAGEAYDDGAKIYIATISGGPYTLVETVAGPITSGASIPFSATGLTADTEYFFVAKGIVSGVESDYSVEGIAETMEPTIVYFDAGFNGQVYSVAVNADGDIYVSGSFTAYNGTSVGRIVKLFGSGASKYQIDPSFNTGTGFNNVPYVVKIDSFGKIFAGGFFTSYNGTSINRIVKLNADGTIDSSFNVGTGFNNFVVDMVIDGSDKVYVGGDFTQYNGVTNNKIIKLNADGSKDAAFDNSTGLNGTVINLQLDSSGRLVVCGSFTTYKGVSKPRILKINTDGSDYATFNVGTGLSTEGRIAVYGTKVYLSSTSSATYKGVAMAGLIRINDDGSKDGSFDVGAGFNNASLGLAVKTDGSICVSGSWSTYKGIAAAGFITLSNTGARETAYNSYSGFSASEFGYITKVSDNTLFIFGSFTNYLSGNPTGRLMKFNFYS